MSSPGSNPMDAVSGLMQERQRFEAWIAALEEKRAITPPHVYERVRGDYEVRLREVIQKLIGRTSELKETVAALTARLAKLQTDENAKRDERYEAELRATVGEFEAERWEKLRGSIDDTINRLAAERSGVSTELARVQQILSMAGAAVGAQPPAEPARPSAPAPSPGVPAPGAPATAPPSAGVAQPKVGRFDELAFLSSVVESAPNGNGAGVSPSGKHVAQPPPAAPNGAPPSSVPPTPGAPSRPPSGHQPVQPAQPAATVRQPAAATQPTVVAPENTEGAVPSYLRDVPTEAAKSLKCNECGTMNLPTEWYCERCGGELAAM
jgi:hypothetical protein